MIANTPNRCPDFARKALAAAVMLMLAACGADRKPVTQLAAKVNADEISVHQVNNALPRNVAVPADKLEDVRREILDRLIYQQLAVQQAIEDKLDRSPDVVMSIEAARRDILTRAYFGKVATGLPEPGADEARQYYAEHPEMFAQRRIYSLQEIGLRTGAVPVDALREMTAGKPLEEVAAWLKGRNVAFSSKAERRSAEQIPPEILSRLHGLKDGQTAVIELPQGIAVIRVAASVPAPLDEDGSLPSIQKFLAGRQAREAIARDIERLRTNARIEYLNEFAGAADEAPARQAAAATAAGQAGGEPIAANLEKGVAALQ